MISEGIISMAEIFQGGTLREYDRMHEHPFKYLRKTPNTLRPLKARLVHIDEIGFVFDPGPPN
jgi:CRISPR-associated endonuclease Csn1